MSFSQEEIERVVDKLEKLKNNKEHIFHLFNHQAHLSWFMNQGTKTQLTKDKKNELNYLGTCIYFLFSNRFPTFSHYVSIMFPFFQRNLA